MLRCLKSQQRMCFNMDVKEVAECLVFERVSKSSANLPTNKAMYDHSLLPLYFTTGLNTFGNNRCKNMRCCIASTCTVQNVGCSRLHYYKKVRTYYTSW